MRKGYSEKELLNAKKARWKLTDLEFLKAQSPTGPFTKKEKIERFLATDGQNDEAKNKRLYIEVRYARNTSLSLKPDGLYFG